MSQTIEALLSEEQVLQCCKYLRQAIEERRVDPAFDITPLLCEIANTTGRMIDIPGQQLLERRVDFWLRITWRQIDDFELSGALYDAEVLTLDETDYVCPFRGDTFEEALKFMREENARRRQDVAITQSAH